MKTSGASPNRRQAMRLRKEVLALPILGLLLDYRGGPKSKYVRRWTTQDMYMIYVALKVAWRAQRDAVSGHVLIGEAQTSEPPGCKCVLNCKDCFSLLRGESMARAADPASCMPVTPLCMPVSPILSLPHKYRQTPRGFCPVSRLGGGKRRVELPGCWTGSKAYSTKVHPTHPITRTVK